MLKRFLVAFTFVVLAGCSSVSSMNAPLGNQTVADARNIVFAVKSGYGVALPFVTLYIRQTPCSLVNAPSPPLCSDTAAVKTLAKLQQTLSSTINKAEMLALSATASSSVLATAISAMQSAYAEFQTGVTTYGIKIGG